MIDIKSVSKYLLLGVYFMYAKVIAEPSDYSQVISLKIAQELAKI